MFIIAILVVGYSLFYVLFFSVEQWFQKAAFTSGGMGGVRGSNRLEGAATAHTALRVPTPLPGGTIVSRAK